MLSNVAQHVFQVGNENLFLKTCVVTPTDKRKVINLLNQGVDPNVEVTYGYK